MTTTNLFLTDNGMVLCREHLGVTAAATGRDLSGQAIEPVTAEDAAELDLSCEDRRCCGGAR